MSSSMVKKGMMDRGAQQHRPFMQQTMCGRQAPVLWGSRDRKSVV